MQSEYRFPPIVPRFDSQHPEDGRPIPEPAVPPGASYWERVSAVVDAIEAAEAAAVAQLRADLEAAKHEADLIRRGEPGRRNGARALEHHALSDWHLAHHAIWTQAYNAITMRC